MDLSVLRSLESASAAGDLQADIALNGIFRRNRVDTDTFMCADADLAEMRHVFGWLGASMDPRAWRLLGKLRFAGFKSPCDFNAGRYWLERAAIAGDPPAMTALAGFLLSAALETEDEDDSAAEGLHFEARFWFASAVLNGDAVASGHVAMMLQTTDPDMWTQAVAAATRNLPKVQ